MLHDRICGSHFFALIMQELQKEGVSVALRSRDDKLMPGTNIYVVDTLGSHIFYLSPSCSVSISYILHWSDDQFEKWKSMSCDKTLTIKVDHVFSFFSCFAGELRYFYSLTPIAVIGGSFFPDLTGHNISEAAAAGCAVLTGQFSFIGPSHFLHVCFWLGAFFTGHHVGHFAHMVQEMRRLNPLSVLQVWIILFSFLYSEIICYAW